VPLPKRMRLNEVPNLVELRTGNKPTLATVYNWCNKGRLGEKLKIVMGKQRPTDIFPNVRLTTQEWVDDFLARVGSKAGL
jgi:hypothetical protein